MATPRSIPSIDQLLQRDAIQALVSDYGRSATVDALRQGADALRARLAVAGHATTEPPETEDVMADLERAARRHLEQLTAPPLTPVINATGVVIHTNLGRAPLAPAAVQAIVDSAGGFVNLEFDLDAGTRGHRDSHVEGLLRHLTGAPAAVVVNNNAAATLLLLAALARGREVIVSRGELVEIGGGFRIPDVLSQSGATLREVGATNKTRAADYAAAINERTALLLRVHPSNFAMTGFVERPSLASLVDMARRFGVLVAEDLGSGNLVRWGGGISAEPTVGESIAAGADVVCFSGDKLLGGPQAGIIVGTHAVIRQIRAHPLLRALRADKLTYAALGATLRAWALERGPDEVPVARMIATTREEIARRANALAAAIATPVLKVTLIDGVSTIGGGSAPGSQLPTCLVALDSTSLSADALSAALRRLAPPVVGRIEQAQVVLDLRTVPPEQDATLAQAIASLGHDRQP